MKDVRDSIHSASEQFKNTIEKLGFGSVVVAYCYRDIEEKLSYTGYQGEAILAIGALEQIKYNIVSDNTAEDSKDLPH